MMVKSIEQRIGEVIGQILVDNAKLGFEIEVTRQQAQAANERANDLTIQVEQLRHKLASETERADQAESTLKSGTVFTQ